MMMMTPGSLVAEVSSMSSILHLYGLREEKKSEKKKKNLFKLEFLNRGLETEEAEFTRSHASAEKYYSLPRRFLISV